MLKKRLSQILKVLILFLMAPDYLHAYDFENGGIYYNIIQNTTTVRVTYRVYAHMYTYEGDIIIPEYVTYDGIKYNVVEIDRSAFRGNVNLKSVKLPKSIVKIQTEAFCHCSSLSTITIPNSVTEIGQHAFEGCKNLVSIDLPNSITGIGSYVFQDCNNLASINLPNSIKKIGSYAFSGCDKLSNIYIPNNVTSIGHYAFHNCISLYSLTLPNDLELIDDYTFSGCTNLTNMNIPPKVTSIGSHAFEGCKRLSNIDIHDGTTSIGMYAFSGCVGLKTIILPNSLMALGSYAFEKCENLEYVESQIVTPFDPGYNCFSGIPINSVLCVPDGTKEKYRELDWRKYFNDIVEKNDGNSVNLSISVMGEGSVLFNGTTIRGKISTFNVKAGTNATIKFNPDKGYRIKSVKVDNSDVTSKVSNDQYTISNINANTNVEVVFEAIPPTTYILTITCSGNGSATFDGNTVRAKSSSFSVNEGTNAIITFTPDNGYRIKSVKVNNTDVTSSVSNNQYTINNINANMTVEVEFEAIPVNTYLLEYVVDGETYKTYEIDEGAAITPEAEPTKEGYSFSGWSEIPATMPDHDVTVIGTFTKMESEMSVDDINYEVVSFGNHTVVVTAGDYGQTLEVPETIEYGNNTWTVMGVKDGALDKCESLAAVIWNPSIGFNARASNPNLLLYVKDKAYASLGVNNVVVNGTAENIELRDALGGNDFYCPKSFKAKKISYSHRYNMETGLGDSKGWETIVLPFDVQKYTSPQGDIVPFTNWAKSENKKPFWLFELTSSGYKDVEGIKANTPYIISMPNNPQYLADYVIVGIVTFSAENVEVKSSDEMQSAHYQDRTFVPNYINLDDKNCFALNVNNYYVTNSSTDKDGSKFIKGLRSVRPFEAYMTTTSNTRSIDVLDGMATAIKEIMKVSEGTNTIKVYDTKGVLVKTIKANDNLRRGLANGVYIVNGKKMIKTN